MAIYAIGDIQGCFNELQSLLEEIGFDPKQDTLWFTGDLVNRGPQSLEVLRFIKNLGHQHVVVLGNHDLHLLAVYYGARELQRNDTLATILAAPDREELMDWLRARPLFHSGEQGYVMSHAGLAPMWSVADANRLTKEVEQELLAASPAKFFREMFGNSPDQWSDNLNGMDRLRCIVNYFTRMRFCHNDGRLNFDYKGTLADKPADLVPWFDVLPRANANNKIIFGHWAALNGHADVPNVYPLDTGCVWGNHLTAMRLGDEKRFSVRALSSQRIS